mmetsp:Transcript_3296/g.7121  ORF Transcript_3296/g.7121 Transcript_3296/m.7121 type:complete len:240 (+) Transcript_3296:1398-2117(+)
MAAVREGRGAVAVLCRDGEGRDLAWGWVNRLLLRGVHASRLRLLDALEVVGESLTQVGGDDRGGSLHGTEAKVIARCGDDVAQEVWVLVHRPDRSCHDAREGFRCASCCRYLGTVEEVEASVTAEGEVVVLSRAVDPLEGLLMQQCRKAVLGRNLLHQLHDHQILVDLSGGDAKVRGDLILVGGDLPVARVERDTHLKALVLHLPHEGEGGGVKGGHVVVRHLLAAGGEVAHDCAACEL